MKAVRKVIGCMTGTSLDGLDISCIEVYGHGLDLKIKTIQHHSASLSHIKEQLSEIAKGEPCSAQTWIEATNGLTDIHIEAIEPLLAVENVDLIAVHGQTLYHHPPHSIQAFNPSRLAQTFKVPVVSDMRAADLACGGEGAPITPIADWLMYRSEGPSDTVVLNLGGFSNYTFLSKSGQTSDILGGDICACNQFLDTIIQRSRGLAYDEDGQLACAGEMIPALRDGWLSYFKHLADEGRSLGTGDECFALIDEGLKAVRVEDVLQTACQVIAQTVTEHIPKCEQLIVAGGGAKNRALVGALKNASKACVQLSDDFGIPVDYRESVAMAVLGALSEDQVPITLSQVTGVETPPVAGVWVRP